MTKSRLLTAATASALVVIGLVGCAPPEKKDAGNQTESGVNAKEATSAADFGGMDGLVKAANAEGELNVIALHDFSTGLPRSPYMRTISIR